MAIGFSKIQRQFVLLIGIFLILTLVLHLLPVYYDIHTSALLSLSLPTRSVMVGVANHTSSRHILTQPSRSVILEKKVNIWRVVPDDDRIVAQVNFVPSVDRSLPPKRILLASGVSSWSAAEGKNTFLKHQCPIQNCELLSNPPVEGTVDARMFKEIELNSFTFDSQLKLTPRHPDQIWIMFALESPEASPSYDVFHDVINWTATYRYDSTLITPYDKFQTFDNYTKIDNYKPDRNWAEGKTKLAAMFVSNCYASNDRLGYAKTLQRHMEVDIYGFCGTMNCDKGNQQACFEMLRKDYKFYFAFENANCRDYITEKLFLNALRYDVVPVVMGAHPDDYRRVAPAGSYIHVEDFPNPEELAKYLIKLSKDDDEYSKYFRWKQTGSFIDTKFWCRICSMLWDPDRPHLSVPDLDKWWRGDNVCIGKKRWDQVLPARNTKESVNVE